MRIEFMEVNIIFYFNNSPNFIITFPTKTDFSDKFIDFFMKIVFLVIIY